MSWVDVENAMQSVIKLTSGLGDESVTWGYQNKNEPELDHVVIQFGGAQAIGIDRILNSQDLSRPNGQEMMQQVIGVREVPFEFQCYTADVTGDDAAHRMAERIRTGFRLESVKATLRRVSLTVFDNSSPVNYLPYVPSASFRGRAVCTVRCYVPVMDCIEYVGYIARVRGTIYPVGWQGISGASGFTFDSNNG